MISAKQAKSNKARRARRVGRVRANVRGTAVRPRLAIFRSSKHMSAQVIDDVAQRTLVQASDREVDTKLKGVNRAEAVGKLVAERAKEKKVSVVVFDRRHYQYHGLVKALADGARAGGLEF